MWQLSQSAARRVLFMAESNKLFIDFECHFYRSPKFIEANERAHPQASSKLMSSSCFGLFGGAFTLVSHFRGSFASLSLVNSSNKSAESNKNFPEKENSDSSCYLLFEACLLFLGKKRVKLRGEGDRKLVLANVCARINFYIGDNIEVLFIRIYLKFHPETFFCCFRFYSRVDRWENISPSGWNVPWCMQINSRKKNDDAYRNRRQRVLSR
jgi:hypothetical protein